MKNKGFTLVELLAVIIVLGLIAVITVPKINDQVEQSRKNIAKNSAINYQKAVEEYTLHEQMNKNNIDLNGTYNINEKGILYNKDNKYQIEISGEKPKNGNLVYVNNELTSGCITMSKYAITFENGEVKTVNKGVCQYTEIAPIPELVTTGDGLYATTTSGRYVYRGTNPDNYLWLDENGDNNKTSGEIYRIISYEPDKTIKVVRNETIGNMAWDEANTRTTDGTNNTYCTSANGCNVWGNQVDTLFQGNSLGDNFHYSYYSDNTTNILTSGGSGKVGTSSTLNVYLNGKTNSSWQPAIELDEYIENHSFNVGGVFYKSDYVGGDKGIEKEKYEESLYNWNGKIGLMNITEYVETSTNQGCTSVYSNYYYNTDYYYTDQGSENPTIHAPSTGWPCKKENWAFKDYNQWTMSPYPYSRFYTWDITGTGSFSNDNGNTLNTELAVRPSFYLKSSIILSGKGTDTNPYYIVD